MELRGLPAEAVAGVISADGTLQVNSLFREFLHQTIAVAAPSDPDLQQAAAESGEGRLVYIDARVPEEVQPVPTEDILGWFAVRGGQIVAGSYLPNPQHQIDGVYGFTAAAGAMRQAMVQRLRDRDNG